MAAGTGMSFAEFAYPLLQAWDWWHLFKKGAQIQIGGADQFGNILAGAAAVKEMKKGEPIHFESDEGFQGHVHDDSSSTATVEQSAHQGKNINEPMGFTVPLLTTSGGDKIGKSAGNAIWLEEGMTNNFDLYQYFLRTADADVERYLKLFTFLATGEIKSIMEEHRLDESKRIAQHKLAFEFVELIRGLGAAETVQKQHQALFDPSPSLASLRGDGASDTPTPTALGDEALPPGDWNPSLNKYAKPTTAENASSVYLTLPWSLVVEQPLHKVLWSAGLVVSKGEGFRLIGQGGCYVGSRIGRYGNTIKMGDNLAFTPAPQTTTMSGNETQKYIIDDELLIFKIGKWKMKIIKIIPDEEYEKSGLTCPGWKEPDGDNAGKEESFREKASLVNQFRAEKAKKASESRLYRETWRPKTGTKNWPRS